MCGPGLGYLPAILLAFTLLSFIVSYIIAVGRDDVSPGFPYISDTGAKPPESCIFGQCLNLSAFLSAWVMYIRYQMIKGFDQDIDRKLMWMNRIALGLGVLTALGMSLVANFQETNVETVHIIGASFCFGCGLLYGAFQTSISYHMHPVYNGLTICRVRLAFCLFCFISIIVSAVMAALSRYQKSHSGEVIDRFHWKPGEAPLLFMSVLFMCCWVRAYKMMGMFKHRSVGPVFYTFHRLCPAGYAAHMASTVGEWCIAISFLCFFATFVKEFQKVDIEIRTRLYVRHLMEEPVYPTETTKLLPDA